VLSTLTTGWHYVIDVLGGLAVAALAVAVAKAFFLAGGQGRRRAKLQATHGATA